MAKNWQELVETAPTRSYQRKAKDKSQLLARYVPHDAFKKGTPPAYLYARSKRTSRRGTTNVVSLPSLRGRAGILDPPKHSNP